MPKSKLISAAAILLLLWYIAAVLLKSSFLPYPHSVFLVLPESVGKDLGRHFLISLYRILTSLAASVVLAVPLGLYLGRRRKLDDLISPMVYLLYPIPKIVFLPLVLLIFGLGDLSKIFILFIILFFQILVTTRDASKGIDEEQVLSIRSLGADSRQVFLHAIFPACLPKVLTSLRISIGTSIAVLFFVESFATNSGLGFYILDAWSTLDYLGMYNGIVMMGVLGVMLYEVVERIEKKYCLWMFELP